jgi:hypothetical protein
MVAWNTNNLKTAKTRSRGQSGRHRILVANHGDALGKVDDRHELAT